MGVLRRRARVIARYVPPIKNLWTLAAWSITI
jgi:hypothetical protein